ncbi:hypothetical protein ACET3Z_013249 [Daucus carota]
MMKKKRSKKTARLKQSKLDARRKQWVSQVKNHGPKGVDDEAVGVLEMTGENRETEGLVHNCSDFNLSSNCQVELGAGSNCSGTNFSGSSRSTSCTSYSGYLSDGEEDGGFDDWEALADALAASADKQEKDDHQLKSPVDCTNVTQLDPVPELVNQSGTSVVPKPNPGNRRAWRPDDAFRPHCLPNLVQQESFPTKPNRICGHEALVWVCEDVISVPTPCPICCEDMDMTDSSFLPCSCGFQLCLFCHKRIVEDDGPCPGCRKPYESDAVKGEEVQIEVEVV